MRSLNRLRSLTLVLSTGVATLSPLAALSLTACGGGDATPPPQAPVATPAAPPAPSVDLSKVAEPQGLVMSGRIARPTDALKEVGVWTSMPMPGPAAMSEMIAGGENGKLIDMSKAIDFAMTVTGGAHPKPALAIAAAVNSMDEAKSALGQTHKLVPVDNGVFLIRPQGASDKPAAASGGDDDDDNDDDDHSCALAPSFGDSAARIVCGLNEGSVTALLPYLTRTATRTTSTSDVHLEIRPSTLKPALEMTKQLIPMLLAGAPTMGAPVFDLINAAAADLVDFTGDVKQMTVDMKLSDAGIDIHGVTNLQGAKSVVSQMLVAHPERADAPPPQYFKLPADADIAGFSRGSDPQMWAHPLQLVGDAVASFLENAGVTEADSKLVDKALVDALTPIDGPSVSSHGIDGAAIDKAVTALNLAGEKDSAKKTAAELALAESRLGWWVVGRSDDATSLNKKIKEVVDGWNRPSIAKVWKSKMTAMAFPQLRVAGAVAGAPAGTKHYTFAVERPEIRESSHGQKGGKHDGDKNDKDAKPTGGAKPSAGPVINASKPLLVHIIVVPDGASSWIGVGGDEASVLAHLKTTLAGADGTLASRAGLDKLKNGRMTAGGFFDAHGLFGGSPIVDWMRGRDHVSAAVAESRSKAGTPIIFTLVPSAPSADASAGSAAFDMNVPSAAISEATKAAFTAFASH